MQNYADSYTRLVYMARRPTLSTCCSYTWNVVMFLTDVNCSTYSEILQVGLLFKSRQQTKPSRRPRKETLASPTSEEPCQIRF